MNMPCNTSRHHIHDLHWSIGQGRDIAVYRCSYLISQANGTKHASPDYSSSVYAIQNVSMSRIEAVTTTDCTSPWILMKGCVKKGTNKFLSLFWRRMRPITGLLIYLFREEARRLSRLGLRSSAIFTWEGAFLEPPHVGNFCRIHKTQRNVTYA